MNPAPTLAASAHLKTLVDKMARFVFIKREAKLFSRTRSTQPSAAVGCGRRLRTACPELVAGFEARLVGTSLRNRRRPFDTLTTSNRAAREAEGQVEGGLSFASFSGSRLENISGMRLENITLAEQSTVFKAHAAK